MANESRSRQGRQPAASQNSATLGVILVVFAVFIAILLFNAGGGNASGDSDKTAAESANASNKSSTTTSAAPPSTTPPAAVKLLVGNGSRITGRAKTTADKLKALGYTNISAVDGKDTATTMVYFAAGHEADAQAVAAQMQLTPDRVQPVPAGDSPLKVPVGDAAVVVLVGPDFDPATAPIGTTSTPSN
jgi:hypothetical protein